MDNEATVKHIHDLFNKVPSPEGCGCARRKKALLAKLDDWLLGHRLAETETKEEKVVV